MTSSMQLADPASFSGADYRLQHAGLATFADRLADLADKDRRVVAGSADLTVSTMMTQFERRHPERYFEFGIAERNMVSVAAGLAAAGYLPFVTTFASFASLMCLEQIRTDLAYPKMPVRVIGTHAGLALGFLSTSHHATEDVGAVRSVAGVAILSAADGQMAGELAAQTMDWDVPIYIRLTRGRDEGTYPSIPPAYKVGEPFLAREGRDVAIVTTGLMVGRSLEAADTLAASGTSAAVIDLHTIKPLDTAQLAQMLAAYPAVLTVEEHNVVGGLGSVVAEALFTHGVILPFYKHGLDDEYSIVGPPTHQLEYYGLDPAGIAAVADRLLARPTIGARRLWAADDKRRVLLGKRPDLG